MNETRKKPVLLFTSRDICYYSADFFANQMADAFERAGYPVKMCMLDTEKNLDGQLTSYIGKSYEAILDFNSLLPRMVLDNNERYVDQLDGPFYNYLVDHPFYHHPGLAIPLKNYHAICIDAYHVAYAKKYYPHLKSVSFLPLGATKALSPVAFERKKERVLFIGTYNSSNIVYEEMKALPEDLFRQNKAIIDMMQADPCLPQEKALKRLLEQRGEELTDPEFAIRLNTLYHADRYLRNATREAAIRVLVQHKIPVTVMGNNWTSLGEMKSEYFSIRPPVDFSMTFQKMTEYAVMLNVSPLFKAGAHDRVFAAMANESVCLTDENRYLTQNFKPGEDIACFSFSRLTELPDMAEELLLNRERRRAMTLRALEEFDRKCSWQRRTEEFIKIMKKE